MGTDRNGADRKLAIVGLGYVGLPLAIAFVEAGLAVEGIDASEARVAELREGRSPIDDVSDDRLAGALASGLSVSGTGDADVAAAEAIVVCVPTPISEASCGRPARSTNSGHPPVDHLPGDDERSVPA